MWQTCAGTRLLDISLTVKLGGQKLSKVRSAKFFSAIIGDQLTLMLSS